MTKKLTEQWKNETLKSGFYWLKVDVGGGEYIDIVKYDEDYCDFIRYWDDCIKEVLAPVPSYDEVKEMSQKIERLEFDNEALEMAHNEGKEINAELVQKMHILEKQLSIATKALKYIRAFKGWQRYECEKCAEQALKEMEGVK